MSKEERLVEVYLNSLAELFVITVITVVTKDVKALIEHIEKNIIEPSIDILEQERENEEDDS